MKELQAAQAARGISHERALALALIAITAIVAWLCWQLVEPFYAPLAWALALAVVAHPLYAWLCTKTARHSLCAALITLCVSVLIMLPAGFAVQQVGQQAGTAAKKFEENFADGRWRKLLQQNPRVAAALESVDGVADLKGQAAKAAEQVPKLLQKLVTGSLQLMAAMAVAMLLLFFFLRDGPRMLEGLRRVLPLSRREASLVFRRVDDTIYATMYGTLAVAVIQGALGAMIFLLLGLPAPLLWGSAMAALAIVPVIGTAIVWGPAALYLLIEGSPGKAVALVAWGLMVIGLVDNLIQPYIVKGRMHAHFMLVFISLLGGLAVFGTSGVVLGPVILTLGIVLLEIWRRRFDAATSGEDGPAPS